MVRPGHPPTHHLPPFPRPPLVPRPLPLSPLYPPTAPSPCTPLSINLPPPSVPPYPPTAPFPCPPLSTDLLSPLIACPAPSLSHPLSTALPPQYHQSMGLSALYCPTWVTYPTWVHYPTCELSSPLIIIIIIQSPPFVDCTWPEPCGEGSRGAAGLLVLTISPLAALTTGFYLYEYVE